MAKYSKKKAKAICSLIERDSYTIAEICEIVGISESCFYNWQANNVEFGANVKEAREKFQDKMLAECEKSLVKLVKGYDYDEKKTVMIAATDGKPSIKEQTTIKKHIVPNLGAIIHYQTNKDPENWKNRQNTELTGKGGKDLFAGITDEELDARIAEHQKKLHDKK